MTPWTEVLAYALTVVLGIITNFCVAAYYAGKYKERVERLTGEVLRYEGKVEAQNEEINRLDNKLGMILSALTGKVNGVNLREEGH